MGVLFSAPPWPPCLSDLLSQLLSPALVSVIPPTLSIVLEPGVLASDGLTLHSGVYHWAMRWLGLALLGKGLKRGEEEDMVEGADWVERVWGQES